MEINKDMKILIADNHESMRRIVKQVLNDLGFRNVKVADDSSTALPVLKNENFDFWVSDWDMPQMQGIDSLKAVRADDNLKNLPVLMTAAEVEYKRCPVGPE
ncbi:MAG: two-component system chemotaxis response regulator CheY [Pseudohongiellaceae bacterium]|jgi:two-component system chemotaxis response regulator CheY